MDTVPLEEGAAQTRAIPRPPPAMSGAPCPAGDAAGPADRARGSAFRPQAALLNQPAAAAHGQARTGVQTRLPALFFLLRAEDKAI